MDDAEFFNAMYRPNPFAGAQDVVCPVCGCSRHEECAHTADRIASAARCRATAMNLREPWRNWLRITAAMMPSDEPWDRAAVRTLASLAVLTGQARLPDAVRPIALQRLGNLLGAAIANGYITSDQGQALISRPGRIPQEELDMARAVSAALSGEDLPSA